MKFDSYSAEYNDTIFICFFIAHFIDFVITNAYFWILRANFSTFFCKFLHKKKYIF